jgi:hypothetical protein
VPRAVGDDVEFEYPHPRWRDQLEGIRRMRVGKDAAVDDFGCGPLGRRDATSARHMRIQVG